MLWSISSAFAQSSPTSQGRWSLGGSATLKYEYNKFRTAHFGYSFRPQASYFVLDGLELSGGVILANFLNRGDIRDPRMDPLNNFNWGLGLGVHYFFQTGSTFQPYVGFDFGTIMVEWEFKQIVWFLQVPVGVAWFISPDVAIDFGIPISLDFSSTAIFEKFTISLGYLGVRAFF